MTKALRSNRRTTLRLTSRPSSFGALPHEGREDGGDESALLSTDVERSDGGKPQGSCWSRLFARRARPEEEKLWPDAFYTPEVWEFLKDITPSLVRAWEVGPPP